jgi:hypothetical protein
VPARRGGTRHQVRLSDVDFPHPPHQGPHCGLFGDDPFGGIDMNDPRRLPADLPSDAAGAIAFLEGAYNAWYAGVSVLTDEQMARPLGPKGGRFGGDPMAALVVHLNREIMHHGGEIGLLRDLYAHRSDRASFTTISS